MQSATKKSLNKSKKPFKTIVKGKGEPEHRLTSSADNPMRRTSAGLRDALFDEIDALRAGKSNPARARSVASLANSVLQSVIMEIEYQKYVNDLTKPSALTAIGVLELGGNVSLA